MEVRVVLSSDEIVRGLEIYKGIAKQDVENAEDIALHREFNNPDVIRKHAEARRTIYAKLTELAETKSPSDVALEALECYKELPFVSGTGETEYIDIKGQENALENFFLMIGLERKIKREVRSQRPKLSQNGTY